MLQPWSEVNSAAVSLLSAANDTATVLILSLEFALHHFIGARWFFLAGIRLLRFSVVTSICSLRARCR